MVLYMSQAIPESELLLVTDSREDAKRFCAQGGCVIGIDRKMQDDTVEFPEAMAVAADESDLTEPFMRMIYCHFHGIPYQVAETARLMIRESIPEDQPKLCSILEQCLQSGETAALFHDESVMDTLREAEAFTKYCDASYRFFGYGMWSVIEKESGQLIGWCGLYPGEKKELRFPMELGYLIAPDKRGRGLAKEACAAICEYAKTEIGTDGLSVCTKAFNTASRILAKSLGFTCVREETQSDFAGDEELVYELDLMSSRIREK